MSESDSQSRRSEKPLVTVEQQREVNLATGKGETRLFIKVYFEARDSGLLADMPDDLFKTLIVLGTHMDENGYCFPSQGLLAKELGISRQAVNARVKRLLAYRFKGKAVLGVKKQTNGAKGRFSHNGYTVYPITNIAIFDHDKTPAASEPTVSSQRDTVDQTVSSSTDTVPTDTVRADTAGTDTNQKPILKQNHTHTLASPESAEGEGVCSSSSKKQEDLEPLTLIAQFHAEQGRPVTGRTPPHRELKFARALIADFGFERASYVVRYGLRAAQDTNYTARFLQGFEQYVGEAIEDFSKHQEREQQRERALAEREAEELAELEEARDFYAQPLEERVERALGSWVRAIETLKKRKLSEEELAAKRDWFIQMQQREEAEWRVQYERRTA